MLFGNGQMCFCAIIKGKFVKASSATTTAAASTTTTAAASTTTTAAASTTTTIMLVLVKLEKQTRQAGRREKSTSCRCWLLWTVEGYTDCVG